MKLDESRIILEVICGSRSYGTSLPTSDLDTRGIFIAPREYYLGFTKNVEQVEFKGELDRVIYELRKFMKLAAACNPNVLELLFTRDEELIRIDDFGRMLRAERDLFLSKKCLYTYSGYAHSQLGRIKRHKKWLLEPPKKRPERSDYGLPEKKLVPKDWITAIANSDLTSEQNDINASEFDSLIDAAKKEKNYFDALQHWKQYQDWKKTRNPARAELEQKFGFDTKHGSHLIRLLRTCVELLRGDGLQVYRHDAENLFSIRDGAYTYDQLLEEADILEKEAKALEPTSTLPHHPDMNKLDDLCIQIVRAYNG